MTPKANALRATIKAVAVSGMFLVWVNFTQEALKMARHIMSTSPGDCKVSLKMVCANCREYFYDDEYLTIILRNRAEYRLILSRRGRRPSG